MNCPGWVHNLTPFIFKITDNFGIRWYGLAYVIGFLGGWGLMVFLAKRKLISLNPEEIGDFIFTLAIGIVAGGRIGYALFYSPDIFTTFTSSFPYWELLAFHHGGMASHGGMIGFVLACLYYAKKRRISFLTLLDIGALCSPIGLFFGRIANFINGELYGRPVKSCISWGVKFPQEILTWPQYFPEKLLSLKEVAKFFGISQESWQNLVSLILEGKGVPYKVEQVLSLTIANVQAGNKNLIEALSQVLPTRHPSQLYEAFLEGIVLFLILFFSFRKKPPAGFIAGMFGICYALLRVIAEQFREPDVQIGYQIFGLTRGQILSFALFAAGVVFLAISFKKREKS